MNVFSGLLFLEMRPETKHRLALEWLILLCSVAVGFGALLLDEIPSKLEIYWKSGSNPIWVRDASSEDLNLLVYKYRFRWMGIPAIPRTPISSQSKAEKPADKQAAKNLTEPFSGLKKADGAGLEQFRIRVGGFDFEIMADDERYAKKLAQAAYFSETGMPPPDYRNSYRGQIRAIKYALSDLLLYAVVGGAPLGIGIYIVLWVPRLTLRAVRIVRTKPPVA